MNQQTHNALCKPKSQLSREHFTAHLHDPLHNPTFVRKLTFRVILRVQLFVQLDRSFWLARSFTLTYAHPKLNPVPTIDDSLAIVSTPPNRPNIGPSFRDHTWDGCRALNASISPFKDIVSVKSMVCFTVTLPFRWHC